MPEQPSRDLIRQNIRELLTLLADAEAQRQFERNNPIVNTPAELLCMWFDDRYCPDDATFRSAFTASELDALARFDAEYEAVSAELRPWPATVLDLHALPAWARLLRAAAAALMAAGLGIDPGLQARDRT